MTADGYAAIAREWAKGDRVRLDLDMPVERVRAHPEVRQDVGRIALMRGPLVYCLEGADNPISLNRVSVPDVTEGDGAARPGRLNLRWDASDPNGDDLSYTLHLRKDGWPDWIKLGEEPLTEKTFSRPRRRKVKECRYSDEARSISSRRKASCAGATPETPGRRPIRPPLNPRSSRRYWLTSAVNGP